MKNMSLADVLELLRDGVTVEIIRADGSTDIPVFVNGRLDWLDKGFLEKTVSEIDASGRNRLIIVLA